MFAGRYIWWLLTSTVLLSVAIFAFDFVAMVIVAISDCARQEGVCYTLNGWLMGSVKPALVGAAAALVVLVVLIRVLYLRFFWFWPVPVLIWALATAGAMMAYDPLWREGADYVELALLMPPAAFAFVALALFLCFPLEEEDDRVHGGAAPIGILAGFMALMCVLHTFATSTGLAGYVLRLTDGAEPAVTIENMRRVLATALLVANGNPLPGYLMTILFALALALRILRHERLVSGQA